MHNHILGPKFFHYIFKIKQNGKNTSGIAFVVSDFSPVEC